MIDTDQPTNLPSGVVAAVSSKSDGQMQLGWQESVEHVVQNRQNFLNSCDISMSQTVLVRVRYHEDASYDLIRDVDSDSAGEGMYSQDGVEAADCLVTSEPGVALFLPIADCIATILYDPVNRVLALAHLGRHSTVANLASKLVVHMQEHYGSDPKDVAVWMSPAIAAKSYTLSHADFAQSSDDWKKFCLPVEGGFSLDMQGYNFAMLQKAGVLSSNIHISPVDVAASDDYWSHYTSRTVRGEAAPPRFAAVCMLKE